MNATFLDLHVGEIRAFDQFTKELISDAVILSRKEICFVPRYLGYVIRLEPYTFFQSTSLIMSAHVNLTANPPRGP